MSSALGPLGTVLGGIVGGAQAGGDYGQAQGLTAQAVAALQGVQVPTDLASQIYFKQLAAAGQLTPAQEQAISAGPSAAGAVQANPQLQAAQMQALNQLKGLSTSGMSSADQARLNQIQQQSATQAQGARQGVMQNFAQRGEAGSGNELMNQLMATQNANNQASQQGLGVAANAQQNALAALGQYGTQAGNMNTQQFGQQFQTGSAQDAMNRFNVQNQQAQQARNVAQQNAAQQYNLQNAQNIQNQNTGMYNQGLLLQRAGEQQQFADAMQKATGQANADTAGAQAYMGYGNQKGTAASNLGGGIGGLAGQLANGIASGAGDLGSDFADYGGDTLSMAGGAGDAVGGAAASGGAADAGLMVAAHGGEVPDKEDCYWTGGGIHPHDYNPLLAFGGHVPKSEDRYVMTSGNGFDSPNNDGYANGGGVHAGPYDGGPQTYAHGGYPLMQMLAGGKVPGKAKVKGDSYENDVQKILVSPGEIIIPKSITESEHAGELARKFVECELKKHGIK
jgi:hypothetical protein